MRSDLWDFLGELGIRCGVDWSRVVLRDIQAGELIDMGPYPEACSMESAERFDPPATPRGRQLKLGGYIGESTASEIAYAERMGRPVVYHEALRGGAE